MSEELRVNEKPKFNKVDCPMCHLPLNLQTRKSINYKLNEAENKVWCRHCQRWVKFSLD